MHANPLTFARFVSIALLLLFAAGCGESVAPTAAPPQTPGRVFGRVVSGGAARLPGVSVSLRDLAVLDASTPTTREAVTDAGGRFAFDSVQPSSFVVSFTAAGFAPASVSVSLTSGATLDLGDVTLVAASEAPAPRGRVTGRVLRDGAAENGHADIRVFAEGQPDFALTSPDGAFVLETSAGSQAVSAVAFGYEPLGLGDYDVRPGAVVELPRPFSLLPQTGAVRAQVLLPAGYDDPARLARAVVTLMPLSAAATPDQARSEAPAADGVVLFAQVVAGPYRVTASIDDGAFEGSSTNVVVRPGELSVADDLRLRLNQAAPGEAPAQIVGRARLQGVLDEAEGHGGVVVSALTTPLTAVTAPDGRFILTGVPTGSPVTLRFERDGYGAASLELAALAREEVRDAGEVVLSSRPGEVRGRVVLDRFGSADALADVSVTLLDAQGGVAAAAGRAAGGAFLMGDVPAGEYTLRASLPGYQASVRDVAVRQGSTTDVGGVLLQHDSGTPAAVRLTGRVQVEGGSDAAGATVRVRIAGRDIALAQAITDAAGRFEVAASAQEAYRVDVERAGWVSQVGLGPYRWSVGQRVFLDDAGRGLDVTLTPEPFDGRIEVSLGLSPGWVVEDGFASSAEVQVVGPQRVYNETVRIDRAAALEGLPEGAYLVRVSRRGFRSFEQPLVLRRGDEAAQVAAALTLERLADAGFSFSNRTLTPARLCGLDLRDADLSGATLEGDFGRGSACGQAASGPFDLRGARLAGADLTQASLRGVDLSYATLFSADLSGAELTDASLFAANLTNASLRGARLSDAASVAAAPPARPCEGEAAVRRETPGQRIDLRGAVLAGADLTRASAGAVDLRATELGGALMVGVSLPWACLRDVRLALTDLSEGNLEQADGRGMNLVNSVLLQTSLRGADLRGANLQNAVLERADLSCVQAEGGLCECVETMDDVAALDEDAPRDGDALGCRTRLNGAAMTGANLLGADLSGADLSDAAMTQVAWGEAVCGAACRAPTRLVETRLDGANLAGVTWSRVEMARTTMRGADLRDARFSVELEYDDLVLTGADLTGASLADLDIRTWDIQNTNLRRTDFSRADARNVAFDGATFDLTVLDDAQVDGASFDYTRHESTFDILKTAEWKPTAERVQRETPGYSDRFLASSPLLALDSAAGVSFRGARIERGEIKWIELIAGLNLDNASVGRCRNEKGNEVTESGPVEASSLFWAIVDRYDGALGIRASTMNLFGGSFRGIHSIDADGVDCPLEAWRMIQVDAVVQASSFFGWLVPGVVSLVRSDLTGSSVNTVATTAELSSLEGMTLLEPLKQDFLERFQWIDDFWCFCDGNFVRFGECGAVVDQFFQGRPYLSRGLAAIQSNVDCSAIRGGTASAPNLNWSNLCEKSLSWLEREESEYLQGRGVLGCDNYRNDEFAGRRIEGDVMDASGLDLTGSQLFSVRLVNVQNSPGGQSHMRFFSDSEMETAIWGAEIDGSTLEGPGFWVSGSNLVNSTLTGDWRGALLARGSNSNLTIRDATMGLITWDALRITGGRVIDSMFGFPDPRAGQGDYVKISLRRADLHDTRFEGTTAFHKVDMRCANLRNIRASAADGELTFDRVNLAFADLRGADLSGAVFRDSSARYVLIDQDTILPPPRDGAPAVFNTDFGGVRVEGPPRDADLRASLGIEPPRRDRADWIPVPDCSQSL